MPRHEQKIADGMRPYLEDGEEVRATIIGRPYGRARPVLDRSGARFQLAGPMALVVTDRRLLAVRIGSVLGFGIGGGVKELVGAVPVADVDGFQVKQRSIGKIVLLAIGGVEFAVEANPAADVNAIGDAIDQAKTTV